MKDAEGCKAYCSEAPSQAPHQTRRVQEANTSMTGSAGRHAARSKTAPDYYLPSVRQTDHATHQCGVLGIETCPAEQTELPATSSEAFAGSSISPGSCTKTPADLRARVAGWLAGGHGG